MSRHRIEHIYRRSELIDSGIEYIGGINPDGKRWKISTERAIEGILSGKWSFYIKKNDIELPVIIRFDNDNMRLIIDTSNVDFIELF